MFDRLFGGDNTIAVRRALDTAALRHSVIANNLANANTPGFKRSEVQFEQSLSRALDRAKDPCAPGGSPVVDVRPNLVKINTTSTRTDGNNVSLETESANLAINTLKFETLSQMTAGYFSALKNVINGGR